MVRKRATAGAFICEALVSGVNVHSVVDMLSTFGYRGKCGRDASSAYEQVCWYKSKLKRGHMALEYDDGVPIVVNLRAKRCANDPRKNVNQLVHNGKGCHGKEERGRSQRGTEDQVPYRQRRLRRGESHEGS